MKWNTNLVQLLQQRNDKKKIIKEITISLKILNNFAEFVVTYWTPFAILWIGLMDLVGNFTPFKLAFECFCLSLDGSPVAVLKIIFSGKNSTFSPISRKPSFGYQKKVRYVKALFNTFRLIPILQVEPCFTRFHIFEDISKTGFRVSLKFGL